MRHLSRCRTICVAAACALAASLVIAPPATAAASQDILFYFNGTVGSTLTTPSNSGTAGAGLVSTVVTNASTAGSAAKITLQPSKDANSATAADFPDYDPGQSYTTSPFAAVRVTNAPGSTTDLLNPGTQPFSFGAVFKLDGAPTEATGGVNDDGDNLIQRGLFVTPGTSTTRTQYKIEVDDRKPDCILSGNSGGVSVQAFLKIKNDPTFPSAGVGTGWYKAVCARDSATTVSFTVTSLTSPTATYSVTATIPAGLNLTTSVTQTPLSIGGKLGENGQLIVANTSRDQFNGRVDNAFLDIP